METSEINSRNETQKNASRSPSGGEQAFSWLFCLFYLSILAIVIGVVVGYFFGDFGIFQWVLPFAVLGLLPHATKAVGEALVETRGMSPLKRLGRIIATIHS